MQLELQLTNEPTAIPAVGAMLDAALSQLTVASDTAAALSELALDVIRDAVERAYPPGEEGAIKLTFRQRHSKLEICIRDFGLPRDVEKLERRFHDPETFENNVADQMHWRSFGPEGREFQIVKWLDADEGTQGRQNEDVVSPNDQVPETPPQEYTVQRMTGQQAVQVSQLMYRAYGNTYFNEDVYYPKRVATQNADGKVLSFVAVGEDGEVAGHYALELNQNGPVAEGGQAVVHPAHRGRGLLGRMKKAALEQAEQLDLVGWFADAVSVHTRTQQSHVDHGGHLTAVDLGIAPSSEAFNQIANSQVQRVTCLMYFYWLKTPSSRTIYPPANHQAVVTQIYEKLNCPIQLGESRRPTGHGQIAVQIEGRASRAFVRAERLGAETLETIRRAKRKLVEHSNMEVVFVDLPLQSPATPHVVEELEADGFGFIGVAPQFFATSDVIRMAYLVDPLDREPIKTAAEFADFLVGYALSEQTRVRKQ